MSTASGRLAPVPAARGRLVELLLGAAAGRFPPADGEVEVLPQPAGPADAVVAFTGHHLVAANVDRDWVRSVLPPGDLGAPMKIAFLSLLSRQLGSEPEMLDVVLAAVGSGERPDAALTPVSEMFDHPRLIRARRYRQQVRGLRDGRGGLLTVGHGLAGRVEVSIEVDEVAQGAGVGTTLARQALGLVPPGVPVFAQVSPGNSASLRCFLAAGYRPIGAEVLFHRKVS